MLYEVITDYSATWIYVQPEVAKTTRVCSYDRAGYGWSDPSPYPRTANWRVEELHTLLVNASIQGPYVLVGHSLGGMLARVYAHNYQDEVIGMVLVDSRITSYNVCYTKLLRLSLGSAARRLSSCSRTVSLSFTIFIVT